MRGGDCRSCHRPKKYVNCATANRQISNPHRLDGSCRWITNQRQDKGDREDCSGGPDSRDPPDTTRVGRRQIGRPEERPPTTNSSVPAVGSAGGRNSVDRVRTTINDARTRPSTVADHASVLCRTVAVKHARIGRPSALVFATIQRPALCTPSGSVRLGPGAVTHSSFGSRRSSRRSSGPHGEESRPRMLVKPG